jgi:hypothetical protein
MSEKIIENGEDGSMANDELNVQADYLHYIHRPSYAAEAEFQPQSKFGRELFA